MYINLCMHILMFILIHCIQDELERRDPGAILECKYTCICVCMRVLYICLSTCTCVCTKMLPGKTAPRGVTFTHACAHMHVYVCVCICVHVCVYIHIYDLERQGQEDEPESVSACACVNK